MTMTSDRLGMAGRAMLDLVLPPRCAGCGEIVSQVGDFCSDCFTTVEWAGSLACQRCALPLETVGEESCAACLNSAGPIDRLVTATYYDDISRGLVLRLKYSRRVALAKVMGRAMTRRLEAIGGEERLIVPVPLHRWRIWKRGYNQAGLLAADLSSRTGWTSDPEAIVRVKATQPLARKTAAQRRRAVQGAFRASPDKVAGRAILLVDDVRTTGVTLDGCARALRSAGAASVDAIVWSRVVH